MMNVTNHDPFSVAIFYILIDSWFFPSRRVGFAEACRTKAMSTLYFLSYWFSGGGNDAVLKQAITELNDDQWKTIFRWL
jgi:hypothetical protein